ncbi:PREDICTED: uncharacterized protein LOC108764290 isoform X2 [Trachymyrmex cornetzi]|nr:PREDICTED: uncharacterized protein LOC108764290 isoform X2 [Trachymyrmex cornetzi]
MAKTGGGTMNPELLTTQEEEVLDLMCPTSIGGHPEIEEPTVNLLQDSDEETMEVEFLDEDEENVLLQVSDRDSNEYNIVAPQKRKSNVAKEYNDL